MELQIDLHLGKRIEPIPIEIGLGRELLREPHAGAERKLCVRGPIEAAAADKDQILPSARIVREKNALQTAGRRQRE